MRERVGVNASVRYCITFFSFFKLKVLFSKSSLALCTQNASSIPHLSDYLGSPMFPPLIPQQIILRAPCARMAEPVALASATSLVDGFHYLHLSYIPAPSPLIPSRLGVEVKGWGSVVRSGCFLSDISFYLKNFP